MKNLRLAAMALTLTSGCKTLNYERMSCYKTVQGCSKTYAVTSKVIDIEYATDNNGQNTEIIFKDDFTSKEYRLVRRNNSINSLELELIDK